MGMGNNSSNIFYVVFGEYARIRLRIVKLCARRQKKEVEKPTDKYAFVLVRTSLFYGASLPSSTRYSTCKEVFSEEGEKKERIKSYWLFLCILLIYWVKRYNVLLFFFSLSSHSLRKNIYGADMVYWALELNQVKRQAGKKFD